ncbi:hypothetical protein OWR29_27290 [Actinoplanes sp. Pm04-4]|uniref:Uncharacterized protein n=1 Tax=Paractinoplanes pyxinae TaxID=2997416 RepID=A0ABT4B5F2_9ACTN|nr:hypothetical protein [Actinoplanes pyxinae]MCY1141719.1 hypothetical protein [Actinoplanes pyxinae]
MTKLPHPHEAQRAVLADIIDHLADNPRYDLQGDPTTDAWGSAQWVKYTDDVGKEHFVRVTVEPYKPS